MAHEIQDGKLVCEQAERLGRMEAMIKEIHDKLFIGNGQPAMSIRIDRVERVANALVWFVGAISLAGMLGGLAAVFSSVWVER